VATVTLHAPTGAAELAKGSATVTFPGATGSPITFTATVGASFAVDLTGDLARQVRPGNQTTVSLTVHNTGNTVDGATLEVGLLPTGWTASFPSGAKTHTVSSYASGESMDVPLVITVDGSVVPGPPVEITILATSVGNAAKSDSHHVLVTVVAPQSSSSTSSHAKGKGTPAPGIEFAGPLLAAVGLARKLSKRR
jgi:uncharacterized membrane protein